MTIKVYLKNNLIICFSFIALTACKHPDDVFHDNSHGMIAFIVHGDSAAIKDYPHAVIIYNMGSMCGGSIINSWAVLTAAHCFMFNDDVNDITVHAGSEHKNSEDAFVYHVARIDVHEDYNKDVQFSNDIALVFLLTPFDFGKTIKKAVIANGEQWLNEDTNKNAFIVTGWGMIKYEGPLAVGLLMARLKLVPLAKCSELHSLNMSSDMFCLYGDGVRDTCKGDSGSGVLWHNRLVGIVSHGDGCAGKDKPSVYTNVVIFRHWINKKIRYFYNSYCKTYNSSQFRKKS